MHATSRAARRVAISSDRPLLNPVCLSCRLTLRQQNRTAATATSPAPDPSQTTAPAKLSSKSSPPTPKLQQSYRVLSSVVVSRPPLLTRPLTSFEKAYHLYNRRLNERLALPFTRYFYYKKGTPGDGEWKRKIRARMTAARDIGNYSGYGRDAWNDEVLVGSQIGTWQDTVNQVIRDAEEFREDNLRQEVVEATLAQAEAEPETSQDLGEEALDTKGTEEAVTVDESKGQQLVAAENQAFEQVASTVKKEAVPRPLPRLTDADAANDTKSLNRKLDRTLYLLVKNAAGRWVFPADVVQGKEGLHQAAERILVQAGGLNMNTWVVGNAPVGYYKYDFQNAESKKAAEQVVLGEKVFFMKARIMTGQADIAKNILGDTDFRWLAREEIEELVGPRYWAAVKNMLVER